MEERGWKGRRRRRVEREIEITREDMLMNNEVVEEEEIVVEIIYCYLTGDLNEGRPHYGTTILLYYCTTVLLYYCTTILLHSWTTALLYSCTTALPHYCSAERFPL